MRASRERVSEEIVLALERLQLTDGAGALDESAELLGRGLGIDSIDALQLIAALEERFGLTIDDEELEPELFETVASLADYVAGKLDP